MRIPFNVKWKPQIESGEYKVFAHEHEEQEVRIVCWDNKGEYPIVALIDNEPEKFDKHGRVPGGNRGGEFSLFIVTQEEEMTEFEKQLFKIRHIGKRDMYSDQEWQTLRNESAKLLSLAREELIANDTVLKEYAEVSREQGKAEALKDLPRWKRAAGYCFVGQSIMYDALGFYKSSTTKPGCCYITYESLRMLPGFNE